MARPKPERAAELAAAHHAIADMFAAGAVNSLSKGRVLFIREADLGAERAAALKKAMRATDIMVEREGDWPTWMPDTRPWLTYWSGEVGGLEVVIVEPTADPAAPNTGSNPGGAS
jgi:hypothetical protein